MKLHNFSILLQATFVAMTCVSVAAQPNAQTRQLHALFEDSWNITMAQNPTWASQLGDRRFNQHWPDLTLTNVVAEAARARSWLETLARIPRESLSQADRVHYDLFRYETQLLLEEHSHRLFLIPLTQREGIQTIDELGDSIPFETIQDYEDWISRLKGVPRLVDETIELLRAGIREKRVQPKVTMTRLPAQIDKHIVTSPEQSPFFKPLIKIPSAVELGSLQTIEIKAREIISKEIVPAYQRLKDMFTTEYLPACFDQPGAWQLPDGEKAYSFLARKFTTTKLSPKQIHDVGRSEVRRISEQMDVIMKKVGFTGSRKEFFQHLRTDPKFYSKTPDDLLMRYRATSKRIDPELTKLFRTIPRAPYGIEQIPDKIAPDTTAAYYRVLAADGSRPGTYFVNLYKPEMRPLYEMMALSLHEAVPGHHFQFAIAMEQGELPKFRRYGGERAYTAYIEGWALYAESLGDEVGLYDDPYSKFGQLTYEMWRAVRLVVDTGIHALKWDRQKAIDYFLDHAAKSELDVINEIDRYISWPGQALAYKMGELKIKELRGRSEKLLGKKFDIKTFHDLILKCGPVPLDVLETIVQEWLAIEIRQ